jgi:hypothetical protein
METIITVLENEAIDVNGALYKKGDVWHSQYYAMFIKKGIPFKSGAIIVQKKQGRPRTSTRVQKTLRIEKKHVEDLNIVVKGLNMSDRILAKINEGDTVFKIEDVSISLFEFWVNYFNKNDKKLLKQLK